MKKLYNLWLIACLVCLLSGCAAGQPDSTEGPSRGPTWQEQYDLGVRYLSEGNYEEAILTFTAAIEIDPKRVPAYVGRGDAYVKYGETDENLAAAKADYEKAIELDETNAEAYLGLADVYIRQGDYKKAREILAKGQEFIAQAATATIQNDRDTLLSLSETVASALPIQLESSDKILYTVWNQYKIGVRIFTAGIVDGDVYSQYSWNIEIRPQNSMGYHADVMKQHGFDESKNTSSWYYKYINRTNIASCPCVDWQWNGSFNAQSFSSALQHMEQESFNGALRKMQRNQYVTGQMKDSLRDGAFMVIYEDLDEYPNGERENFYFEGQYTENFDAGEYIGCFGDQGRSTKFSGQIFSIGDYNINWGYDKYVRSYCW